MRHRNFIKNSISKEYSLGHSEKVQSDRQTPASWKCYSHDVFLMAIIILMFRINRLLKFFGGITYDFQKLLYDLEILQFQRVSLEEWCNYKKRINHIFDISISIVLNK